jgi:hypothetical protein
MYEESAVSFRDVARAAGADIILSNHPTYDGSTAKIPVLERRMAGQAHPFVIGTESVSRYLTVAEQCAIATGLTAARGV